MIKVCDQKLFCYLSTKTYIVGTQKNSHNVTALLNTQNICLTHCILKALPENNFPELEIFDKLICTIQKNGHFGKTKVTLNYLLSEINILIRSSFGNLKLHLKMLLKLSCLSMSVNMLWVLKRTIPMRRFF